MAHVRVIGVVGACINVTSNESPPITREQDVRVEGLALVRGKAVDEQPVSFADAVLLATE